MKTTDKYPLEPLTMADLEELDLKFTNMPPFDRDRQSDYFKAYKIRCLQSLRLHVPVLTEQRIWTCWKRKSAGKEPVNTNKAKPATWRKYQPCGQSVMGGHADGLGCYLPDGFAIIDVDGVEQVEGGFSRDMLQKLTDRIHAARAAGLYIEISQSGTGVHILGKIPDDLAFTLNATRGKQPDEHFKIDLILPARTNEAGKAIAPDLIYLTGNTIGHGARGWQTFDEVAVIPADLLRWAMGMSEAEATQTDIDITPSNIISVLGTTSTGATGGRSDLRDDLANLDTIDRDSQQRPGKSTASTCASEPKPYAHDIPRHAHNGPYMPTDSEVMAVLATECPRAYAVYSGDLEGNESEAVYHLAERLLYLSGNDTAQTARIISTSSAVMTHAEYKHNGMGWIDLTVNSALKIRNTSSVWNWTQPQKDTAKGSNKTGNKSDGALPPIKFELSEPMRKVLHGIAAFMPQAFSNDHDPLYYDALDGRHLPLPEAAALFVEGNNELKSYERVFMFAQFQARRIPDDVLMKIRAEGADKLPVIAYTIDDLLALDIPEPEFLSVLGEDGSITRIFVKGLSHCITAPPSGHKTHFCAQSAMYWDKQPVIYCCEEGVSVWHYRIRKYLEAGLPRNPQLQIKPALGEGHSFILDTINEAPEGSIVIVDTLRAFAGVEDEASGAQWAFAVDPWCLAARKRNITLILIHHSRKGASGRDPIENASGSNSLMSRVEQRITINKVAEHIEVFGQAKNWQVEPSMWKRSGDRLIRLTQSEVQAVKNQPATMLEAILEFADTKTVTELYAAAKSQGFGMTKRTITDTLPKMAKQGRVVNDAPSGKQGQWRLVNPSPEDANENDGE